MDTMMFNALLKERSKAKTQHSDLVVNYASTSATALESAECFYYYSELMVTMLAGGLRQCWFDDYSTYKRLFPEAYAKWSALSHDAVRRIDWYNVLA